MISPHLLGAATGTAELGLEYLAREAQQQAREKQAAEVKRQHCAGRVHSGNITGFQPYRNCDGCFATRRFFQNQ
jgi:hypothetical protein